MPKRRHPVVPGNAVQMHRLLAEAGVVSRVNRILRLAPGTRNVTDLLCWVEVDRGELWVKAAYTDHTQHAISGQPAGAQPKYARFRVEAGKPFDSTRPQSDPLSAEELAAIRRIMQDYGNQA